ncbi:MAG: cupin domain-containing protein [Lysobacter sp.]|jgi:uncharacterized cupin superfamily protein|nr:cupin domain-containing protein [Lysobacter sp.]MDQ3269860.1 cupin domain-containing protein [Pseudomonadota bacterium]
MPRIDIDAIEQRTGSGYPAPFNQRAQGRVKQALGVGLTDFGVNLTRLPPGEWSSQRHWHSHEDEFVYVLSGELTMCTDGGEQLLQAGEAAAFPKNQPDGHHLVNDGKDMAVYLEIGSRDAADVCSYPDVDLHYAGRYAHKDGTPY